MHGIDLHTHSNISDGTLSPSCLVDAAIACGIHTLALTDHDTMDGLETAIQQAQGHDIQIISGAEISSQWSRPNTKKAYGVHIVALNMQNPEPLLDALVIQKIFVLNVHNRSVRFYSSVLGRIFIQMCFLK